MKKATEIVTENLIKLRKQFGFSQVELSQKINYSDKAISRWEKGQGYPDMEMLPSIANYFHVSIDYLFGYDNEREERIENILFKCTTTMLYEKYYIKYEIV